MHIQKKIVGHKLSRDMSAVHTANALQAALLHRQYDLPIIHHSDRGIQYNSAMYTQVLNKAGMKISMTQDGSPYDNAVAERVNGILKQEYSLDEIIEDDRTLGLMVKQAIMSYNHQRPHFSCWLMTPDQMHQQNKLPIKTWQTKYPMNKEQLIL